MPKGIGYGSMAAVGAGLASNLKKDAKKKVTSSKQALKERRKKEKTLMELLNNKLGGN